MKRLQATSTFARITGRREPLTRVLLSTFAARFRHRHRHFLTSLFAIMMLCAPRFFITAQLQSNSPTAFDIVEATVDDVQTALRSGRVTCRELVDLYLARIKFYDKTGPALNAIQTVNGRVLQEADRLDALFKASGPVGPLHCVPVLVKDQIDTSDIPTMHGFAGFKDFIPATDATIVTKLKTAGALIIAKATMGEFASGFVSSASGPIRNAYDPRRNASGSSGGTGSGIAASFATIGIGEDTGGSIRGPASVNSLVGLRPTIPLVSRYGMSPARPSTDTLGPITRTVRDAAIVLDVIAGYDQHDPVTAYSVGHIPSSYTASLVRDGLRGVRIGIIREPMNKNTDTNSDDYKKVRTVFDRAAGELSGLAVELVEPIRIPDIIDRLNKAYDENVFETEIAMNKYLAAHGNAPFNTLREILLSGIVVPSRARTLMSTIGKSTDDIGYLQILRIQEETRQFVLTLMADKKLDALMYATFDHQPGIIANDIMTKTVIADIAGLGNNRRLSPVLGFPAITVPAGFTTDGVPVGIEFMARPFAEPTLLRIAFANEQATRHRRPPALSTQ
jgi:Asp-tRNA(Asn)/Glu-tRNA(Gln) amidotransferase A subunit family amidase